MLRLVMKRQQAFPRYRQRRVGMTGIVAELDFINIGAEFFDNCSDLSSLESLFRYVL